MKILHKISGNVLFESVAETMRETVLDAIKQGANLSGADLSRANLSGADLFGANLSGSDLSGANLSKAALSWANLSWANLSRSDLSGANLSWVNLSGSDLFGLNLSRSDLSGANGLPEVAPVENLDAKILAAIQSGGALDMGDWHTCATTHCRAGWAVVLAGAKGVELENQLGSNAAGALIYAASRPGKAVPDFFATAENAMKSIQEDAKA